MYMLFGHLPQLHLIVLFFDLWENGETFLFRTICRNPCTEEDFIGIKEDHWFPFPSLRFAWGDKLTRSRAKIAPREWKMHFGNQIAKRPQPPGYRQRSSRGDDPYVLNVF